MPESHPPPPSSAPPRLRVGDHQELEVSLTAEEVVRCASLLGDRNPLHHDEEVARRSRFGGLIASGAHLGGLLGGLCATFTTAHWPGVGLETSFTFRRAARAGTTIVLRWEVAAVERSEKLGGDLVTLRGSIRDRTSGELLVEARGKMVSFDARVG